jgi:hypothetical protein
MYEYEFRARSAELLRRAEHERLAHEAVRARRAARRGTAEDTARSARTGHPDDTRDAEGEPHRRRPRRFRFARPA